MNKIIITVLTISIAIFVCTKLINRPSTERHDCIDEKNLEFSGVVDTIIQDKKNLSQSFIFLTNGRKILPEYTYGLWVEVRPGDSIVKKRGTLNYLIYESASKTSVRKLNWDKKCG